LGHLNFKDLSKVIKEFILGPPKLGKIEMSLCGQYEIRKQIKSQYRKTNFIHISKPLGLLNMDLVLQERRVQGKKYIMVIVDDFLRVSWVILPQ
jgi:hypothetical protein